MEITLAMLCVGVFLGYLCGVGTVIVFELVLEQREAS
jgi:hypothetical protein